MKKKEIAIGKKLFRTKKDVEDYVREKLLELEPLGVIDEAHHEWDFFHELIKRHPNYTEKFGPGIEKFLIDRSFMKHIELNLLHIDGFKMDISWKTCVTGKARTPEQDLKEAMRVAIEGQINSFRTEAFDSRMRCELCGEELKDIRITHVDHVVQFEGLVQKFQLGQKAHPLTFADEVGTNKAKFHLQDSPYSQAWQDYHLENAKLRIVHSRCNLSRKREKKD